MATSGTEVAAGPRVGGPSAFHEPAGRATCAGRAGHRPAWIRGVLLAVLGTAALVAGCGPDNQEPPPESPAGSPSAVAATAATSPSPVPADPVAAAGQAALAAYRGMWQAYQEAGRPPRADPDHPDLERYAAGDALDVLTAGLADYRDQGLVFSGSPVLAPEVINLLPADDPTRATVEDCSDSSGFQVVRADGGRYEDEPGGRRLITADLEEVGEGTWKVTSFAVRAVGSC